jgi:catalytic LigB subunit of aromatic ring-opening dioxygenase
LGSITLGIGTSHSPMLSSPLEGFRQHEQRDRANPTIPDYDALERRNRDDMAAEVALDRARERHERNQAAIDVLHDTVLASEIDAMIIVGDDQAEWFSRTDIPAIAIYWGQTVETRPPPREQLHPTMRPAYWGHYGDGSNVTLPIDSALGRALVSGLTERGFDIHSTCEQPDHVRLGHAWGFVQQRILRGTTIPMVPIMLNTYYPPNQPSSERCWQLGTAVRAVVSSLGDDKRVALVASGGLSHFVVDEDLDRTLLDSLSSGDVRTIVSLDSPRLQGGTSEVKNWIVAGAGLTHLTMEAVDYVPFYRTLAGTGVGMAFALWR